MLFGVIWIIECTLGCHTMYNLDYMSIIPGGYFLLRVIDHGCLFTLRKLEIVRKRAEENCTLNQGVVKSF
jgi:hypothetical protein